jgi:hypothetical protein
VSTRRDCGVAANPPQLPLPNFDCKVCTPGSSSCVLVCPLRIAPERCSSMNTGKVPSSTGSC